MANTPASMRVLLTAAAYLGGVAVLAPVLFLLVWILAGPHSSLLPSSLQPAVVLLGWAALAFLPMLMARAVWKRTAPVGRQS
jgi:hypothetical protein